MIDNQNRTVFIEQLRELMKDIISVLDGYIDDNFFSADTISENIHFDDVIVNGSAAVSAKLENDYEYAFFHNLYHNDRLDTFYHYTSFESLFQILNGGVLHMNAITGMNDKSEINLVNNFMGKGFSDPFAYITMAYHNSHFIFCLSGVKDQLNQWRLYGDDAKGVMIEFTIEHTNNTYQNILVSKVFYDLALFQLIKEKLTFFKEDMGIHFGFQLIDYWKFFYKDKDYIDEREIRLLVKNTQRSNHRLFEEKFKLNRYGLVIPYIEMDCISPSSSFIKIAKIMLGPKLKEGAANKAQIQYLLNKKYPGNGITIEHSAIKHYR